MTRKEMITACVDDQIKRGIIKAENRKKQINARLNGWYKMGYTSCLNWYNSIFGKVTEG